MDADYERRKHDAYRASKAVETTFFYECQRAGIDHRNVPKALAELAEREALKSMPEPSPADHTLLLARYIEAMREWEKAETRHDQLCWHAHLQALWIKLAEVRNVKLLGA